MKIKTLTPREIQTLELIAEGLSNKLIAARLDIAEHTAKFHVHNVCKKLGVTTRTEAAVMYIAEKSFAEGFENAKRTHECATCRARKQAELLAVDVAA